MDASMDAQWTPGRRGHFVNFRKRNTLYILRPLRCHSNDFTRLPGVHWASIEASIGRPLGVHWASIAIGALEHVRCMTNYALTILSNNLVCADISGLKALKMVVDMALTILSNNLVCTGPCEQIHSSLDLQDNLLMAFTFEAFKHCLLAWLYNSVCYSILDCGANVINVMNSKRAQ